MSAGRITRHYVPGSANFGRIIFVSSAAGLVTDPDTADYGTVNAAVIRLSRAVAESFTGGDVTVNCIVPGAGFDHVIVASLRRGRGGRQPHRLSVQPGRHRHPGRAAPSGRRSHSDRLTLR